MSDQSRLTSNDLAELIADALVNAKLVQDDDFRRAVEIIEEEIDARKAVGDY